MPAERIKHIIAARNFFFGSSYFVILSLPEGWQITRSYLQPDVQSSIQRENLTWVEAGQTDQVVFHPLKRVALDLMIQVKRGRQEQLDQKGVQVSTQGSQMTSGHTASYCIGEVKQGLFRRKTAKTLRLSFYCPDLNRTLFLHFTGKCQDSDLREIYESIPFLECH